MQLIKQHDSRNKKSGYNLAPGGNLTWQSGLPSYMYPMFGRHHSEKSKEKSRSSQIGRVNSEETRKNMSVSAQNRKRKLRQGWSSKRLTSSERKLIIDEYAAGKISIAQLSQKYDRSMSGILNVLISGPDIKHNKGSSKLSYENVIEIRKEFASGGMSTKELAIKYNIGVHAIRRLLRNKTYKGNNT